MGPARFHCATLLYVLQTGRYLFTYSMEMEGAGSLSFAFTSKGLAISMYPTALRSVLRMEGAEAKDSALERPSFKPVIAAHGEAAMFSIQQTASTFKMVLGAVSALEGLLGIESSSEGEASSGSEPEFPWRSLPTADLVDKYLKGTMTSALLRKSDVLLIRLSMR